MANYIRKIIKMSLSLINEYDQSVDSFDLQKATAHFVPYHVSL